MNTEEINNALLAYGHIAQFNSDSKYLSDFFDQPRFSLEIKIDK